MVGNTLGPEIRRVRLWRGQTQTDLGNTIGSDQGTISEIETGARLPTVDMLRRIAKALDTPYNGLAELAGYVDPDPPARDGTGDIFDRAPLARLLAELNALPTVPGQPTIAEQMRQAERMAPERRARFQRRVARLFLFMLREELEREEEEGRGD